MAAPAVMDPDPMTACSGRWFRQPTHASPPAQPPCTCIPRRYQGGRQQTREPIPRNRRPPVCIQRAYPMQMSPPICMLIIIRKGSGGGTRTHGTIFPAGPARRRAYTGSSWRRRGGLCSAVPRSVFPPPRLKEGAGLDWSRVAGADADADADADGGEFGDSRHGVRK
jgi:hypothetical protein